MICGAEKSAVNIFKDSKQPELCLCDRNTCVINTPPDEQKFSSIEEAQKVFNYLDNNRVKHLKELESFVSIKSLSKNPKYWSQSTLLLQRVSAILRSINFKVEHVEVKPSNRFKKNLLFDVEELPKQEAIFASYFSSPRKSTLLIYGFLDVNTIDVNENVTTDPFELQARDGKLYGRGLTRGKGPLLTWLAAVRAWKLQTNDLPINIKFVIEVMHEFDSMGLAEHIDSHEHFFSDVDCIVKYSNSWFSENQPIIISCITGRIYFDLEVTRPKNMQQISKSQQDTINREPMCDLCLLMNSLVDNKGLTRIPNLDRHVYEVTARDWLLMNDAECSVNDYKLFAGTTRLVHENSKTEMLLYRWCMPSLSIHGVTGNYNSYDFSYAIQDNVASQFSIKLVCDQDMSYVAFLVKDHLRKEYEKIKSANNVRLRVLDRYPPFCSSPRASHIQAARKAVQMAHNIEPGVANHISYDVHTISLLKKKCKANIVILPFAFVHPLRATDNETMPETQYLKNIKMSAAFIYQMGQLSQKCKCGEIKDYCRKTDEDSVEIQATKQPIELKTNVQVIKKTDADYNSTFKGFERHGKSVRNVNRVTLRFNPRS